MSDDSRAFERYARAHGGGAFTAPRAADLARGTVLRWPGCLALERTLTRPSRRRDWLGTPFELPAGTRMITALAREPGARVPEFDADIVDAFLDDRPLSTALAEQRDVMAVRIGAASEMIGTWAARGSRRRYSPRDLLTLAPMPLEVDGPTRAAAEVELDRLEGWHDDYPYYSDGSWSALSLRGYRPDDPTWGVKPAEMGERWHAKHPGARELTCDWTVLAPACPALVGIVEAVPWWAELERVRLLRMAGRGGRGGRLRRHTDITDRAGGTRVGQVVRFHVPLRTDPRIVMHSWDLDGIESRAYLEPWRAWYLDVRKPHAVTNPTDLDRIHLVADVIVDARVQAILEAAA